MPQTPRFSLPLIQVNQAQKAVTHNEAITHLDGLVHLLVESADRVTPPASPAEGETWIVADGASGAWSGQDGAVAQWIAGAWVFHQPAEGLQAWLRDRALPARYAAGSWLVGELRGSKLVV